MADPVDLVQALESRPPTLAGTRLIAIDGPAGSGKTTMAQEIAQILARQGSQAKVLSLDDLYDGWTGLDPSLARRILTQVLEPLDGGRCARWQAYDWAAGRFGEWHDLGPIDVLVLEGCGAGAAAFSSYLTLLVWMETDPDVGSERMVARDGPDVLDHLTAWRASERRHFAANRTRERADIVITT